MDGTKAACCGPVRQRPANMMITSCAGRGRNRCRAKFSSFLPDYRPLPWTSIRATPISSGEGGGFSDRSSALPSPYAHWTPGSTLTTGNSGAGVRFSTSCGTERRDVLDGGPQDDPTGLVRIGRGREVRLPSWIATPGRSAWNKEA